MKLYIDELKHYSYIKKLAAILSKPCIWSIVSILNESTDKTINITALIAKLNSNYKAVSKCLEYMKKLNIVEEVVVGRLRLVRLLDTQLTQAMNTIIKELKDGTELFLDER